ncbi:hypothetical protein HPP92_027929 [Vanilla planifolia]|uniref:Uncharacterized protein n=1 Tax=Vanilla planifolia TaxID=51239 RepID=A0A835P821_VANPL|nr:hypothetical protein HPP92_027929 [Vanilla planifolia]
MSSLTHASTLWSGSLFSFCPSACAVKKSSVDLYKPYANDLSVLPVPKNLGIECLSSVLFSVSFAGDLKPHLCVWKPGYMRFYFLGPGKKSGVLLRGPTTAVEDVVTFPAAGLWVLRHSDGEDG